MASTIKEGFICPECHAEFKSSPSLLTHFQNSHSQEESKSIKSLIEKAKSKLVTKQDEVIKTVPKYYDLYEEVLPGKSISHFTNFKKYRSFQVERLSSEASKLLIRLHKLQLYQGDESKRRSYEKNIVEWIDEKHVPRCPDCTESFNLLQRKHHCRLCGSILCDNCSHFINSELATSLTSHLGSSVGFPIEYHLRTCKFCYNLVLLRGTIPDPNPPIVQLYTKQKEIMFQCEALLSNYNRMVLSVSNGDNLYSIDQLNSVRDDLIKHTEKIDMLSKKIIILGAESNEPISESEKKLRSRLRINTLNWRRDFLHNMSPLPGKDSPIIEVGADGWTPSLDTKFDEENEEEDIIANQIKRTKIWIAEAKKANKMDEVEMLQATLEQLLRS